MAINLKHRKISYLEITINLYLFISNTFGVGAGGGLNRDGRLFETCGLFSLLTKTMVSVLHKKPEYKVGKFEGHAAEDQEQF